jgi:hypothetical protein
MIIELIHKHAKLVEKIDQLKSKLAKVVATEHEACKNELAKAIEAEREASARLKLFVGAVTKERERCTAKIIRESGTT